MLVTEKFKTSIKVDKGHVQEESVVSYFPRGLMDVKKKKLRGQFILFQTNLALQLTAVSCNLNGHRPATRPSKVSNQ